MTQGCATLFTVGSGFPWSEFLTKEGKARGVQIDIQASMLGLRYPMEVNLQGDSKATLRAMLPMLQPRSDHAWRDSIAKWNQEWEETVENRAPLLKGDPEEGGVILGTAKQSLSNLLPHRS